MKEILRCCLGIFVFLFASFKGYTQQKEPLFRLIEVGPISGYGHGVTANSLPEGNYQPLFFIGHFGFQCRNTQKGKIPGNILVSVEPQYNLVFMRSGNTLIRNHEMGTNIGLQYFYPLTEWMKTYVEVGSGPHYISVITENQAKGFIFSDNLGFGFRFYPSRSWSVLTGYRLRHMSNAELSVPNHGINTHNFIVGLLWQIHR